MTEKQQDTKKQELTNWVQAMSASEEKFKELAQMHNAVNWKTEANFARQIIQGNDYLAKMSPVSIRDAVINVAAIGITLNPAEKLAYLVPRDGKCCLDISYRGLIRIATDTGSVDWAKAELVYSADEFEYNGPTEKPNHKSNPFSSNRGEFVGVYCIAKVGNDYLTEAMSADDVYRVRDSSPAYSKSKSGPWVTWFGEMAKKACIKRAYKTWPTSDKNARMDKAVEVLNQHEGMRDITGESDVVLSTDQVVAINDKIDETKVDKNLILTAMGVSSIEQIPANQFDRCIELINKAAA